MGELNFKILIFAAMTLVLCYTVYASNYLTNGQFVSNIVNWTQVEPTAGTRGNGETAWATPGYANGGTLSGVTVATKKKDYDAYDYQTINNTILQNATINLSFAWKGNYSQVPVKFNLTIYIVRPDASIVSLWSTQGAPAQGWNVWALVNIDVSSAFNQDGTYDIRLAYDFSTHATNNGYVGGYYDEINLDVRQADRDPPSVLQRGPPDNSVNLSRNITFGFNVSDASDIANCSLYINGVINQTNTSINKSMNLSFRVNSMADGQYNWSVGCFDAGLFKNFNMTPNWSIIIDNIPPNVSLMSPPDNTFNMSSFTIFFMYNVTDPYPIYNCSLIIDNIRVNTTTSMPVDQNTPLNFTHTLSAGTHNWSINCTNYNNLTGSSSRRNVTIIIAYPSINYISIDDGIDPAGQIILSAGNIRRVSCQIVASDPAGPSNIDGANATLFFNQNKTSDADDYNVHYTNSSCTLNQTTASNKTFDCGFDVYYIANNGTWYCLATAFNFNQQYNSSNTTNIVQPLYALNLTDGIDYGYVEAGAISAEYLANITNIGNMDINISLLGYARTIGDGYSMNCSDNTNISLANMKYSIISTAFSSKIVLTSAFTPLSLRIPKSTSLIPYVNNTYWQLQPDPGSQDRICEGRIIFSAEVP